VAGVVVVKVTKEGERRMNANNPVVTVRNVESGVVELRVTFPVSVCEGATVPKVLGVWDGAAVRRRLEHLEVNLAMGSELQVEARDIRVMLVEAGLI
jgi:hypothetical protein